MIKRLKFSADTKYSRLAGELLADAVVQRKLDCPLPTVIVPVPIHPERLLERGFNQAELIARTSADRLKIRLDSSMLKRSSLQLPQSSLSAREREANIRRAFKVDKSHGRQLHVAVVDDVYTTGATARAIARQLQKAGVAKISIWAVARTP